ncbi:transglutaminase-like cysteine peptidase [Phenylobacterium sp.]|uniref:transglutaminase-like cysteine peptidase n=1 Tax=Phenylobacterium sp. TaxID=1871053 RepID=UPI0035ADEBBD
MSLLFRALAAVLLLPLLAVPAHAASRMSLGTAVATPATYIAFCERRPGDCGDDPAQVLAAAVAAKTAWTAVLFRRTGAAAEPAAQPADAVPPPALGPGLWRKLVQVNADVNRALRPQLDAVSYGVPDFWAAPLAESRAPAGDCEDYVLEKRRALIAAGVPRRALAIAIATTPQGEDHAVLVVATGAGDFVLDNLSGQVRRWDEVPYAWRSRQADGEDGFRWVRLTNPSGR